ncbi:MAG: metalloprotease TldD [Alphaproteobacteria bacterium GM7ARS4]|nr:metalloprotease TldD [Alphaproteobacteria bacterium GM7ARS4]
MSDSLCDRIFFASGDVTRDALQGYAQEGLCRADDGDIFLEHHISERFVWENGRLKDGSYDTKRGFGMRGLIGEASALAYSSVIDDASFQQASSSVASALGRSQRVAGAVSSESSSRGMEGALMSPLYASINPLDGYSFEEKLALLQKVEAYVRERAPHAVHVLVMLTGSFQAVEIVRLSEGRCCDVRPLVRMNVQVGLRQGRHVETGVYGMGGRMGYDDFFKEASWHVAADEAIRHAHVLFDAKPAPVGEMDVVLASGWPGILLHEAIGHGLEGDFNRKKTAAFSELMGQPIASRGVTVVDDGTCPHRRGSLRYDDEGTPSQCTTLIEDGILVNYMHDRLNGRLMGTSSTGNGRRESYAHNVMPRMTNTYMLNGHYPQAEMIESVAHGIYAVNFSGGQVDITSGKFVFSTSEAYHIEKGKITSPVKGATLIGNGPDALTRITMVGDDLALDKGIGTCGKEGQRVPVGVGQPSLRIANITVGGEGAA